MTRTWQPTGNYHYGVHPITNKKLDENIRVYEFVNYAERKFKLVEMQYE